jgi:hypothetical protein
MRLILPVIYRKVESDYKIDANIPFEKDDFVVKNVIFYRIDAIEFIRDNQNECMIVCGCENYRVALSVKEVDKKVMKQMVCYGRN